MQFSHSCDGFYKIATYAVHSPKDLPCLQDRYHVDNYRDFCKRCLDLCVIFTTDFGSERTQGPRDCY